MDSGGEAFLPECAHHPGGEQEGPEERRAHAPRTGQDETGTGSRAAICKTRLNQGQAGLNWGFKKIHSSAGSHIEVGCVFHVAPCVQWKGIR